MPADNIQLQIDALNARVTTLDEHVTTTANNIEEHVISARQDIDNITAKNRLQDSQLSYIEEEIHMIAHHMDKGKADISYFGNESAKNSDNIRELSYTVTSYENTNHDDHNELHEECRLLSYALGNAHDRLDRASYMINSRHKAVIIPEEDYIKLAYKDTDVMYFTFDPEEELDL